MRRRRQDTEKEMQDTKKGKKYWEYCETCTDGRCLMKQCFIIIAGGKPLKYNPTYMTAVYCSLQHERKLGKED